MLNSLHCDLCVMSCNQPALPHRHDKHHVMSLCTCVMSCDVISILPGKVCLNSESTRVDLPQPVSPRREREEGEGEGGGRREEGREEGEGGGAEWEGRGRSGIN